MWKVVLAFAAGAATACAILLTREPAAQVNATVTAAATSAPAAKSGQAWGASPFSAAATTSISSAATPAPQTIAPEPAAATNVATTANQNAGSSAAPVTDAKPAGTTEDKPRRARRGDHRDIDPADASLPDPIEDIIARDRLHPDSMSQLHDDFDAQNSHSDWAAASEQRLKDNLAPAAAARGFSVTSIACHESLCEVMAQGPAVGSGMGWSDVMHDWGRAGNGIGAGRWNMDVSNGQAYVLSYFWKPGSR
jgi:hypothetical protein